MAYKQMDKLLAYLSETEIYMVHPELSSKRGDRKGNEQQYDILLNCPDTTKEEFEKHLKTKNGEEAMFEMFYWVKTKESAGDPNDAHEEAIDKLGDS